MTLLTVARSMRGEIDAPRIRLELTSRPEAPRLVRSMSTAAGEALGFDPELLSDVNTAVSEACNNVIQHAYGDEPGPFWVDLAAAQDRLEIRVRDYGSGIRKASLDDDGLEVGLALMSAVADRAEFVRAFEGGTEVRLCFRGVAGAGRVWAPGAGRVSARGSRQATERAREWQPRLPAGLSRDVVLTVSPVELLSPVLGRIGRALAPSAGFSLDRCADVYLVTDALGAHAERAAESTSISVALGAHDELLEFALCPLRLGTGSLLAGGGWERGPESLATLTDEVSVSCVSGREVLRVAMRDHRRSKRLW
jgi:serine/threonine-protein kinase RsbW